MDLETSAIISEHGTKYFVYPYIRKKIHFTTKLRGSSNSLFFEGIIPIS